MLVDCEGCAVRGLACRGCAVAALVGDAPDGRLDDEECRAIGVLAGAGLLPPLRLIRRVDGVATPDPTFDDVESSAGSRTESSLSGPRVTNSNRGDSRIMSATLRGESRTLRRRRAG